MNTLIYMQFVKVSLKIEKQFLFDLLWRGVLCSEHGLDARDARLEQLLQRHLGGGVVLRPPSNSCLAWSWWQWWPWRWCFVIWFRKCRWSIMTRFPTLSSSSIIFIIMSSKALNTGPVSERSSVICARCDHWSQILSSSSSSSPSSLSSWALSPYSPSF